MSTEARIESQATPSDAIQWRKAISSNGTPFEIGVRKSDIDKWDGSLCAASTTELDKIASDSQLKGVHEVSVHWEVGSDTWKDVSDDSNVASLGVQRYILYRNSTPRIFEYTLEFTNTAGGVFHFQDETEDIYTVTAWLLHDHWVKYNSEKPTIIRVAVGTPE